MVYLWNQCTKGPNQASEKDVVLYGFDGMQLVLRGKHANGHGHWA